MPHPKECHAQALPAQVAAAALVPVNALVNQNVVAIASGRVVAHARTQLTCPGAVQRLGPEAQVAQVVGLVDAGAQQGRPRKVPQDVLREAAHRAAHRVVRQAQVVSPAAVDAVVAAARRQVLSGVKVVNPPRAVSQSVQSGKNLSSRPLPPLVAYRFHAETAILLSEFVLVPH